MIDATTSPQDIVLEQIRVERRRQDSQWGGSRHDDEHSSGNWLKYIDEHRDRARKALRRSRPDLDEHRKQLIEIAALAVAAIESLDRKRNVRG